MSLHSIILGSLRSALALALTSCMSAVALANAYPDKPVKIVVPYPPGGSTDTITRLIAQKLSQRWGQPVVVDNKGGASGIIGSDAVARSESDGYTLLMNGSGPQTINVSLFKDLPYDPVKDFAPIIQTTTLPLLMVAPVNAPFKTVSEFIAWAKQNGGKTNYCSIGPGSPSHLAAELFKSMAKIEMTHIPYRGSGPALIDTMAGVCDVLFDSALSAGPHVKSGKLNVIAIGTEKRVDSWPGLPTVGETLDGFSAYSWTALLAPSGTPNSIVDKINADTAAVLAETEVRSKLEAQGALPGHGAPADLHKFIASEISKWAEVIKQGGITVN